MGESATLSSRKLISLGFIGVGWIGKSRMEAILGTDNAQAIWICEPSNENLQAAMECGRVANSVQQPEEGYSYPGLDGVVIATPNAFHFSQCKQALKESKAVFCQKPLCKTAKEVAAIVDLAKINNKLLAVDLSYRFTNAFQAVAERISSGELGDIYAIDLVFHNAYGPDKEWFYNYDLSGGGCVMDLGIHLLDMAFSTLGYPAVNEINSHLFYKGERIAKGAKVTEDFANVSLSTENTHIDLKCSWNLPAGCEAIIEAKFYGTEGGIAFKNVSGSFYDFVAEEYHGTETTTLLAPPDDWSGRAGVDWVNRLAQGAGFDEKTGKEMIALATILDRIYERQ